MKYPPVVFARQANIANGPKQVNNGVPTGDAERSARTREKSKSRRPNF